GYSRLLCPRLWSPDAAARTDLFHSLRIRRISSCEQVRRQEDPTSIKLPCRDRNPPPDPDVAQRQPLHPDARTAYLGSRGEHRFPSDQHSRGCGDKAGRRGIGVGCSQYFFKNGIPDRTRNTSHRGGSLRSAFSRHSFGGRDSCRISSSSHNSISHRSLGIPDSSTPQRRETGVGVRELEAQRGSRAIGECSGNLHLHLRHPLLDERNRDHGGVLDQEQFEELEDYHFKTIKHKEYKCI